MACEVEVLDAFGFEGGVELGWGAVVVFDGVARADDLGVFETWDGADEGVLDFVGEGCGDPVDVVLVGLAAFGFEEELVAVFLGEADDLVFDGGAVAGADAFDDAGVHGGLVEIGADDVVGVRRGVGDPARHLFHVEHGVCPAIEGEGIERITAEGVAEIAEGGSGGITVLAFALGEVDAATVEAARRAGFEASHLEAEVFETVGDGGHGVAHATAGGVAETDVEETAHEGTGADDDGAGGELETEVGADAGDGVIGDEEFGDVALVDVEVGGVLEQPLHAELVGLLVGLGARRADAGALVGIEHAELDAGGVGVEAHETTEGVDFPDDVSFGESADGGVAGHLGDGVEILGEEGDGAAHASGGGGGFNAGVTGTDDDDVVGFWVEEVGWHGRWGRGVVVKVAREGGRDTGNLEGLAEGPTVPRGTFVRREGGWMTGWRGEDWTQSRSRMPVWLRGRRVSTVDSKTSPERVAERIRKLPNSAMTWRQAPQGEMGWRVSATMAMASN